MSDEPALVERLKDGSPAAFREAVQQFSGAMLATARAIAGPAHAEDIVQDAWLTVFRQIKGFEGRSSLATWLQRIVTNGAISHLRKYRREVSEVELGRGEDSPDWFDHRGRWSSPPPKWGATSPDELLTADELQDCLDKHIRMMPDNQRAVLVMRDMQVLGFEDICAALDLSSSNARVLLHRARIRLVEMINGFQETGRC
jgi:RNA polymerase sigma-70 factor, ECF subfamily